MYKLKSRTVRLLRYFPIISILTIFSFSCETGRLEVIADITTQLKEVSGVEQVRGSEFYWVIEDSGNKNRLYALDSTGVIRKSISIENAKNIDWEDLTTDQKGNIYIGDFGNNRRNRNIYTIYKVSSFTTKTESAKADIINFELPKKSKSLDLESFFILDDHFYIFSKENGKFEIFKVVNESGNQTAVLIDEYKLEGSGNQVTSADISADGKTIVLLNHGKMWELTEFKDEKFFSGRIKQIPFNHSSQKEGVCFGGAGKIIITDENKGLGSYIYRLKESSK